MRRREFIAGLGSAAAVWPAGAQAQQSRMKRIGVLVIGNADAPSFLTELREGLRDLGRIEGQNYSIELRSAEEQLGRLPQLAAELVGLKVDAIVALFTPCALAAKQATHEIPIVIMRRTGSTRQHAARARPAAPAPPSATQPSHRSVPV